ncbi:MAG: hypothetical protein AB8C84_12930 [Oligoflexales bacterium]
MSRGLVYYDQNCFFCRQLAAYAGQKSLDIKFLPCSENPSLSCDRLVVVDGDKTHEGPLAWEWLLRSHSSLQGLGWLAKKLRLESEVASGLEHVGMTFRKICYRCRS